MQREKTYKPLNPMDPHNSQWDVPVENRLVQIENRLDNLEINILEIFKTLLKEIGEEKQADQPIVSLVPEKEQIDDDFSEESSEIKS